MVAKEIEDPKGQGKEKDVEQDDEETQGQDGDRQREDQQDGLDDGIYQRQHQRHDDGGDEEAAVHIPDEIEDEEEGRDVNDEADQHGDSILPPRSRDHVHAIVLGLGQQQEQPIEKAGV